MRQPSIAGAGYVGAESAGYVGALMEASNG
jgi:hypothetical protein